MIEVFEVEVFRIVRRAVEQHRRVRSVQVGRLLKSWQADMEAACAALEAAGAEAQRAVDSYSAAVETEDRAEIERAFGLIESASFALDRARRNFTMLCDLGGDIRSAENPELGEVLSLVEHQVTPVGDMLADFQGGFHAHTPGH